MPLGVKWCLHQYGLTERVMVLSLILIASPELQPLYSIPDLHEVWHIVYVQQVLFGRMNGLRTDRF